MNNNVVIAVVLLVVGTFGLSQGRVGKFVGSLLLVAGMTVSTLGLLYISIWFPEVLLLLALQVLPFALIIKVLHDSVFLP